MENFLTLCKTISFSRRTVLCGVSKCKYRIPLVSQTNIKWHSTTYWVYQYLQTTVYVAVSINWKIQVSGMSHFVTGLVVFLVSKGNCSLEESETTSPATWCYIPADLNPQIHCRGNIKSGKY
jgi:hypothetical protein